MNERIGRGLKFILVVNLITFLTPIAQAQAGGAGIGEAVGGAAAGKLVDTLLEGISEALKQTEKAQVRAVAKIDGPHPLDDVAFDSASDEACWPLGIKFERALDADTGLVWAPNHGKARHEARAFIHYSYQEGGWKPYRPEIFKLRIVSTGTGISAIPEVIGYEDQWGGMAKPQPDGIGEGTTRAAAVAVFGCNGKVEKVAVKKEGQVTAKEQPRSPKTRAISVGCIMLQPSWFSIERMNDNLVVVRPLIENWRVELFHNYMQLSSSEKLLFPPSRGMHPFSDDMLMDIWREVADNASWILTTDSSKRADFTLTGAAVEFFEGYVPVDVAKTREDALAYYLANSSYVRIVAPAHSQPGYSPNVLYRAVLMPGESIRTDSLPLPLVESLKTTESASANMDLIRLCVGVSGKLEDAISLAANTPGTEFYDFFQRLKVGETFELDLNYFYSSSNELYAQTTAGMTHMESLKDLVYLYNTGLIPDTLKAVIEPLFGDEIINLHIFLKDGTEEIYNIHIQNNKITKLEVGEDPNYTLDVRTHERIIENIRIDPATALEKAIEQGKIVIKGRDVGSKIKYGAATFFGRIIAKFIPSPYDVKQGEEKIIEFKGMKVKLWRSVAGYRTIKGIDEEQWSEEIAGWATSPHREPVPEKTYLVIDENGVVKGYTTHNIQKLLAVNPEGLSPDAGIIAGWARVAERRATT